MLGNPVMQLLSNQKLKSKIEKKIEKLTQELGLDDMSSGDE